MFFCSIQIIPSMPGLSFFKPYIRIFIGVFFTLVAIGISTIIFLRREGHATQMTSPIEAIGSKIEMGAPSALDTVIEGASFNLQRSTPSVSESTYKINGGIFRIIPKFSVAALVLIGVGIYCAHATCIFDSFLKRLSNLIGERYVYHAKSKNSNTWFFRKATTERSGGFFGSTKRWNSRTPANDPIIGHKGGWESWNKTVIIISLDGFRAEYLKRGCVPTLRRLAKKGVSSNMYPVFPTITFPNHFSMATGMYPCAHGIVNNEFYDPKLNKCFSSRKKIVMNTFAIRTLKTDDPQWWLSNPVKCFHLLSWIDLERRPRTRSKICRGILARLYRYHQRKTSHIFHQAATWLWKHTAYG